MKITRKERLERALIYLEEDREREIRALKDLENNHLKEIIILRNKKQLYLAEVDQMIRNARNKLMELGRCAG